MIYIPHNTIPIDSPDWGKYKENGCYFGHYPMMIFNQEYAPWITRKVRGKRILYIPTRGTCKRVVCQNYDTHVHGHI